MQKIRHRNYTFLSMLRYNEKSKIPFLILESTEFLSYVIVPLNVLGTTLNCKTSSLPIVMFIAL